MSHNKSSKKFKHLLFYHYWKHLGWPKLKAQIFHDFLRISTTVLNFPKQQNFSTHTHPWNTGLHQFVHWQSSFQFPFTRKLLPREAQSFSTSLPSNYFAEGRKGWGKNSWRIFFSNCSAAPFSLIKIVWVLQGPLQRCLRFRGLGPTIPRMEWPTTRYPSLVMIWRPQGHIWWENQRLREPCPVEAKHGS